MHFIIIAIACWQVNLVHLVQQVNGMVHYTYCSPIMLALCLMLLVTYHALNYAGIIGLGLVVMVMHLIFRVIFIIHFLNSAHL